VEPQTIAYVLLAFLTAAFLKGITGLGFSTICLGLLASFVDIKIAIPLAIIPSLSSNLLVMVDAGGFRQALGRFWIVYVAAIPGLVLGLWLLGSVQSSVARTTLGVVLLVYGAWGLLRTQTALPAKLEKPLAAPVGFVTGIVNGLTGSQVMPVLPYFMALELPVNVFVQAINISFTVSSVVMLSGLVNLGLMDWSKAGVSVRGIVPVAGGIWAGGKVRKAVPESVFRRLVLALLVALGVGLAVGW
jgi:uncharacterized membrane protein YfcA